MFGIAHTNQVLLRVTVDNLVELLAVVVVSMFPWFGLRESNNKDNAYSKSSSWAVCAIISFDLEFVRIMLIHCCIERDRCNIHHERRLQGSVAVLLCEELQTI